MNWFKYLLVMMSVLLISLSFASVTKIRVRRPKGTRTVDEVYKYQLLKLALEKTISTYGNYKIEVGDLRIKQAKAVDLVKEGFLDVLASMTSKYRERELLPIRIPVYKGTLGYRIFIINKKNKDRFKGIKTLEDFKKFSAGQGHDWPDTKILKNSGINVVTSSNYQSLFKMVEYGRFDYFPRGLFEPWVELKKQENENLMVEEHILLQYCAPLYFFVNKKNRKLRDRIKIGLEKAISDGSFDKLFFNHFDNKDALKRARLNKRNKIKISNPLLSKETPFSDKRLWFGWCQ